MELGPAWRTLLDTNTSGGGSLMEREDLIVILEQAIENLEEVRATLVNLGD